MTYYFNGAAVQPCTVAGQNSCVDGNGSYHDVNSNVGAYVADANGNFIPSSSTQGLAAQNVIQIGGSNYTASQLYLGVGIGAAILLLAPGGWKALSIPAFGYALLAQHL